MIFDMHTHSKNSHDSECEVSKMAEAAKTRGLCGVAVTDHCDIEYYETLDLDTMVGNSVADAERINGETDLTVLRGIEIGEGIWHRNVTEEILKNHKFDVVIGSVHAVRFKDYEMPYSQIVFSDMDRETVMAYLNQYFDDCLEMAETEDYDILAHMTCPLRYVNGKYGLDVDCRAFEEKITLILAQIIEREKALEVNTSCMSEGSGYYAPMPEEWIIRKYKEMGGYLITPGSDAHIAENSANSFDEALKMLKDIGFEKIYYYKDRKAIECKIDWER